MFNTKSNSIIYFVKIGLQLDSLMKAQNRALFAKTGVASSLSPRQFPILCHWKAKIIIYNFHVQPKINSTVFNPNNGRELGPSGLSLAPSVVAP